MTDTFQHSATIQLPPAYPICAYCKGPTRLFGIEPHMQSDHIEIHTFGCDDCGTTEITVIS
jgi:hypothetical protein